MEKLDGFFLAEFVVFEGQKVEVLVLAEFEILIFENFFEKCSFGQDGGCEFYFIELGLFQFLVGFEEVGEGLFDEDGQVDGGSGHDLQELPYLVYVVMHEGDL